jgi:ribosomal protein S6
MATKKVKATAEAEVVLRVYEAGYHIASTVKEEDVDGVVASIRSIVEKADGSFIAEGAPALMKLAYPMYQSEKGKRTMHDRAYFGWLKFEAPSTVARELADALQANKSIIRSMVFVTLREDTRAKFKAPVMREVRRGEAAKTTPRKVEESAPVSEEKLDEAIETLTV